ncbi:retrovirus-related pol polyprotein from transposon TNT 1-94, partial [Tanacetum coccineum]
MNFISKFLGTVRFGNDQIVRIMRYGDYQLGNVIISRVYYVEGLGNNLFFVGQFCDADLEVAFQKNTCFIRNLEGVDLLSRPRDTNLYTISLDDMLKSFRNVQTHNGTEFVNQTLREWYENVGITHQTSLARTPQQNGVVERQNRTLVEAARTMLIFSKASLFLGPKLSILLVTPKTDLGKFDTKADIGLFVGYAPAKKAFKIYNKRTRIITETINVTFDELTAMASEQICSGHGLHYMTHVTSSTRLGSNPVSQQPCSPPIRDDWDRLLADSPVSTSIDQDAPSTSIPSSQEHEHSLIISQGFEESPKIPTFHDDPLNESP